MKGEAPILQRLGAVPFWRGRDRFQPSLEAIYRRAAEHASAALEADRRRRTPKKRGCWSPDRLNAIRGRLNAP